MKYQTEFSFVPTFPQGTVPMAIATVIGHMSARAPLMQMRSMISEIGARNAHHLYGFNGQKIAGNLFGTAMTPIGYLREHTLFGFLEKIVGNNAMTEDDQHFLCEGKQGLIAIKRTFRSLLKLNPYLSWCPICCQEDLASHGFSVWKVMHQFPFVQHCLIHREPLLHKCDDCHRIDNSGRDLRLPPTACRYCGSKSFFRPSSQRCEAYWRLIDRMAFLRDDSKKEVSVLVKLFRTSR
jgi:DNA-directed RNA polymerase subunit RPC12/RpoP